MRISRSLRASEREITHEVIIYWSVEDSAFIAEVPQLPGCMADGKTHQAALKAVRRVATEWVETARELGRMIRSVQGPLDLRVIPPYAITVNVL